MCPDCENLSRLIFRPTLKEIQHSFRAALSPKYNKRVDYYNDIYNKYQDEIKSMSQQMANNAINLDVHKKCACLCAAIIKTQGLIKNEAILNENNKGKYERAFYCPNEMMAIWSAMLLMKNVIMVDYDGDEAVLNIIEEYTPYFPSQTYDEHSYLANILTNLSIFSHMFINGDRDYFDVGAYSTIFYHLEKDNYTYVKNICAEKGIKIA